MARVCCVWGALILGVLLVSGRPAPGEVAEGRFAGALRSSPALGSGPMAEPKPDYNAWPLTVECWARILSKTGFNILIANEPKSSPTHWELYTYAGSGRFSLYQPGYTPAEVISERDLADGRWHYLALVRDQGRVRLYVDAELVAEAAVTPNGDLQSQPGTLAFGALAEGGLGCDGYVDEVRLSNVARPITRVPNAPFTPDGATIGLWHFDRLEGGDRFADASPLANPAVQLPPGIAAAEAAKRAANRDPSLVTLPPKPDLAATRQALGEALATLKLPTLEGAATPREGLLADWEEQYWRLGNQLSGKEPLPSGAAEQAFDAQALVRPEDGDPLGVVLRRTEALASRLAALGWRKGATPSLAALRRDLKALKAAAATVPVSDTPRRKGLYLAACALRRQIAFGNPLLDFDSILFVARGVYQGSRWTGPAVTGDVFGQHFATQYFAFNSIPGGGLYLLRNYKTRPEVVDLLRNSVVENGRLRGRRLTPGAFLSPDLSYDGKTILFAYTENREHRWVWSKETTWNLFRVNVDGSGLRQLTDSAWNDFDPVWLPNGRVAFISERRGGYIRCFAGLHVPSYVLHSMRADGSDIIPISYYETSEWHPSVDNHGMIVYTRWDYTDRENCLGSNFWICYPDGRDPRAPHGNYPYPWHTFPDNQHRDTRIGRPYTEMNIRAIPGSPRYILTAAPHHGEAFGSLCILDLAKPDDGFMSQLQRITPYVPFPETQFPGRSQYPYGTAWPLSEDFYLCNVWENLYLLDRFGNQELLCENALVFGKFDPEMRLIDPIPVRPRPRPPIIPTATNQGAERKPDRPKATIRVLNIYDSDIPFPPGTRIKWLRIMQNGLKENPIMGVPMIGYQNENTPRIPLGIAPVEEDGSVYVEAPVERELIFQALDENYMAVQSMRSVAFVHPGEQLTCQGCHESKQQAPPQGRVPLAWRRQPSKLQPEVPVEPITYYRLVKPVFERACIPCHQQQGKGPVDMSYEALEPFVFYFAGGMSGETVKPIHGGSRTLPGRFGARYSRMGQALLDEHHRGKIAPEDYRCVVVWLDSNSLRLGAYHDEEKQVAGEVVWWKLDADPTNPQGLER